MNSFFSKMTLVCLLISSFTHQIVLAQHLPDRFWVSEDGKRLITGNKPSDGFYDNKSVEKLELTFSQANYWQQLTNNYASKTEIPATLTYNGKTYPNVGVRFRGNTSYQKVPGPKKSFSISLDFKDAAQNLKGYETLHLNNAAEDPSYIREVLYLEFNRRHIPSAKANFVHLFINGESWGEYPNIQVLNGEFMKEWFLSNDGTRWRAERVAAGGGGGGGAGGGFGAGTSSLNFLGTDTTLYKPHYTLKKGNKPSVWRDLAVACEALNNPVEENLKKVLDTDRALWFVAHEIMFGDDDGYVNKGGMDYYVFWDKETNRIVPIEYDGNSAFGSAASGWSPFLKETNAQFPLMSKLLSVPALRQRYLAHVRTMIEEDLDETYFNSRIDYYFNQIDSYVKNDTKKGTTYDQFVAQRATLKTWLKNRRAFYLANAEVNRVAPAITDVVFSANNTPFTKPNAGQPVSVTAKASHSSGISQMTLYYATGFDGYFDKNLMFDDGAHGDGVAKDGIFGGTIPSHAKGTFVRFYVEATANDAAKTVSFMPKGAEHDVYMYQVNTLASAASGVVINEIMAANLTTQADPSGQFDDWIELYNPTNATTDISNFFLSDDVANRSKWKFPQGTTIPANGYLTVWADEDAKQVGLHANFKLSASGETLILSDKDTAQINIVPFGVQQNDKSWARKPNGTGNFGIQAPSFNKNNDLISTPTQDFLTDNDIRIYPNPTTQGIQIEVNSDKKVLVQIFNLLGQRLYEATILERAFVKTEDWQQGMYVVKIGSQIKKLMVER
jgi:CotH kinase protein/Lamin Tail Domain/Secretion system C-terminal sorting domain